MKKLHFHKYQGTGNDFILIDNTAGENALTNEQITRLCDRRFGIGSDGLILIQPSLNSDFDMVFYNPDGSQSFCGNGSRCAVQFAHHIGIASESGTFNAIDGIHGYRIESSLVQIDMRDVLTTSVVGDHYEINTGSPHLIIYTSRLNELDVFNEGRKIRYSSKYASQGINVNFVEEKDNSLLIRTYERGVENETYSCGTGVTAAALSYHMRHPAERQLTLHTLGGPLNVKWEINNQGGYHQIVLSGPANFVFEGEITI